jgi:AraC family transcriptional regulator
MPNFPPTAASYVDFFAQSDMARFDHSVRIACRWPVRLLKVRMEAHEDKDPPIEELLIGLTLGGSAPARWSWDGGKWNHSEARLPGHIGVSPFHSTGLFQVDGPSQLLVLGFPISALREFYGEDISLDFGVLHDRYMHSPLAMRLCIAMWQAAGRPGPVSDDLIEAAASELILMLKERSKAEVNKPPKKLSAQQIRTLDETFAEWGPTKTTVRILSDKLNMPVRSFRRQFQATLGKRPHSYLLEHRIKMGCILLEQKEQRLADIAVDLGFANQAHFTMEFVRQLGISPAKYRHFLRE